MLSILELYTQTEHVPDKYCPNEEKMIATKTIKKLYSYDTQKQTCLVHNCVPKDRNRDASNNQLFTGNALQKSAKRMSELAYITENSSAWRKRWRLAGLPSFPLRSHGAWPVP